MLSTHTPLGHGWQSSPGISQYAPLISKNKAGPGELFIQLFSKQLLSLSPVPAVTQCSQAVGENHHKAVTNDHVVCSGPWSGES